MDQRASGNGSRLHPTRAGLVSRAAADLLDAVVVVVGTAAIVLTASMLRALFVGSPFTLPRVGGISAAGWLSTAYLLYLTFFWTVTGRTPGKQASGLRVVTAGGDRVGLTRAAARALLCVVFPIGLLWVLVSPRNRAMHDAITGTAVVYDWRGMALQTGPAGRASLQTPRAPTDP